MQSDPNIGKKKFCTKCGEPLLEGKSFCANCGSTVAERGTLRLPLPSNHMKPDEVINFVNGWLAQNPYLYNVRFEIEYIHYGNDIRRANATTVSSVTVAFDISQQPVAYRYGLAYIYRCKSVGPWSIRQQQQYNGADLVKEWNALYPSVEAVSYTGGRTVTDDAMFEYVQFVTFRQAL
jgi:hypothetical protein